MLRFGWTIDQNLSSIIDGTQIPQVNGIHLVYPLGNNLLPQWQNFMQTKHSLCHQIWEFICASSLSSHKRQMTIVAYVAWSQTHSLETFGGLQLRLTHPTNSTHGFSPSRVSIITL